MHKAILSIGTNRGDKAQNLQKALELIEAKAGKIVATSSVYETDPWGYKGQSKYFNQVVICNSNFSAENLLKEILQIEKKMGRKRNSIKYDTRIMDIDILFYDNAIVKTKSLTIPHPLIHKRNFVLIPLHEIIPEYIHPLYKKTIKQLLKECDDNLKVRKVNK